MTIPLLFDRSLLHLRKKRAAMAFGRASFLFEYMAKEMVVRLQDMRKNYGSVLIVGSHQGIMKRALIPIAHRIGTIIEADVTPSMLVPPQERILQLVLDPERLPLRPGTFDLILCIGCLHSVNDLPGMLIQLRQSLSPNGLFLGTVLGPDTLIELRQSILAWDTGQQQGTSPRVSPFIDVRDAGSLLQRAGFQEVITDSDTLNVSYSSPLSLFRDLRHMGETNILAARHSSAMTRGYLAGLVDTYIRLYSDEEHRIPARFEVVTLTGMAA